jgi:hypothetical protein
VGSLLRIGRSRKISVHFRQPNRLRYGERRLAFDKRTNNPLFSNERRRFHGLRMPCRAHVASPTIRAYVCRMISSAKNAPATHQGCSSVPYRLRDGRTRDARLVRDTRRRLIEHVGGNPTGPQRLLIERAAMLALRCAQMDADLAAGRAVDDERYLAATGALARIMARLGMRAAASRRDTVADYFAARLARRGEGTPP